MFPPKWIVSRIASGVHFNAPVLRDAALCSFVMLVSAGLGTWSFDPIIWNDSAAYIESALRSLSEGRIVQIQGVSPGYPLVIAFALNSGIGLEGLVAAQHIAWWLCVGFISLVLLKMCRRVQIVPLLPVVAAACIGGYPGIQNYSNIIYPEMFYTVAVTTCLCFYVLALLSQSEAAALASCIFAILFGAVAATLKHQGLGPFVVILTGVLLLDLGVRRRRMVFASTVACATFALTAIMMQLPDKAGDRSTRLFGAKTLFCFHLNVIVASEVAEAMIEAQLGSNAQEFRRHLRSSIDSKSGSFPTLGYYADACQFDSAMDDLGLASLGGVDELSRFYREVLTSALLDRPAVYTAKVAKQLFYGFVMAIPPHALGKAISGVSERREVVVQRIQSAGYGLEDRIEFDNVVDAPIIATLSDALFVFAYRVVSVAVGFSIVVALLLWFISRQLRTGLGSIAAVCGFVWLSQIGGIALTHTLDIWRYIVPVVPAGAICAFALWLNIATGRSALLRLFRGATR